MEREAGSPLPPLRRAEYDQLVSLGVFENERIELLEGALVPMSPIGPPHASAVQKLGEILIPRLLGRAAVFVQSPFAAEDWSEPEPDVVVAPRAHYDTAHPERAFLVIEVAESSLSKDRGVKLRLYAENGVPEYWIVNLVERTIEVYRDPEGHAYRTSSKFVRGESIAVAAFPDVIVAVSDVMR